MRILLTRTMKAGYRQGIRPRRSMRWSGLEGLEGRVLLATVAVNASQVVRPVDTQLLGVNVAWYDSNLNTSETQQMVQAAGLTMFRFPGGSSSDDFHFNAPPTYNGEGTDASMASFIASVNGVGLATLDYGSGSPQEAAAFLAYLDGARRQHDPDRQRPGMERLDQFRGRQSTGRRPATGPACVPPPRWRRTTASTSSGSTTLPRSISSTGRSATRNTGAGRSTTTRPSTTRRPTSRLPSSSRRTLPRSRRASRSASTWEARGLTSTTGRPTSCSSRSPRDSCRGS